MDFRLTYSGPLLSTKDEQRVPMRSRHVHAIRQRFHEQLRNLWRRHPVLIRSSDSGREGPIRSTRLQGFTFKPIATVESGLTCQLDILMLRGGRPGRVIADIDNRLKTLFDALRMPRNAGELGAKTSEGQISPMPGEEPFYVLLENDDLITSVKVTTDILLEDLCEPDVMPENAARIVISAAVRPYDSTVDFLSFN